MANVDAPRGARPIGTTDGSDWHGKTREVSFASGDAVACYVGDFVKLTGTNTPDGKTPIVAQAAAGDAVIGAVVGFAPDFASESFDQTYRSANAVQKALICWGSDVLYSIQEDSVGAALTAAQAGLNASIIVGAGDAITGMSGMEIDSSTAAATATLKYRLHRVENKLDNDLGNQADWIVSINVNQDDHGTGV